MSISHLHVYINNPSTLCSTTSCSLVLFCLVRYCFMYGCTAIIAFLHVFFVSTLLFNVPFSFVPMSCCCCCFITFVKHLVRFSELQLIWLSDTNQLYINHGENVWLRVAMLANIMLTISVNRLWNELVDDNEHKYECQLN